jgi:hypothetical protein
VYNVALYLQPYNKLTSWCQNPEIHHRVHKSPQAVPILSQVNPLHTLPANVPRIHFDTILPSMPRSFEWSFSFGLSHQNFVHLPLLSHTTCPGHIILPYLIGLITSGDENKSRSSRRETFSILPLLHSSEIQIFSPTPSAQTPSVYAISLTWEIKFHAYTLQLAQLWSCTF